MHSFIMSFLKLFSKTKQTEKFPLLKYSRLHKDGDTTGKNFIVMNNPFPAESTDQDHRWAIIQGADDKLATSEWDGLSTDNRMIFKMERCGDYPEDWKISLYGPETNLRWVARETVQLKGFPNGRDWNSPEEPPQQWRFTLTVTDKETNRYRISSKHDELGDSKYLTLVVTPSGAHLEFQPIRTSESDSSSQIWSFVLRDPS